jgi:NAD(P)-dependent dehydrogenase (short-subunit alcohol dehydrogenase family)
VAVNAILPGLFHTKVTGYQWESGVVDDVINRIPLSRPSRYDDVAGGAAVPVLPGGSVATHARGRFCHSQEPPIPPRHG